MVAKEKPELHPLRQRELEQFVRGLGLPKEAPIRWDLLHQALTHATYSAEANYDQLEFVGDAVVKLATAEYLLTQYPEQKAGEMTAIRSILVSDRLLARIANKYNFNRYLLVGSSAAGDRSGRDSRLADALEAVLASLYLSTHDLSLVHFWLDAELQPLADEIRRDPAFLNYKGALQELTSAQYKTLPEYRVEDKTQTHDDAERFAAEVWILGECYGTGRGASKKLAEQAAAQMAFKTLRSRLKLAVESD
jgi:ribonuclease-3